MGFNDRCEEAARWVRAHEGDTFTMVVDKRALLEALRDGREGLGTPLMVMMFAREHARHGSGMSRACWEASADPDDDWVCMMCGWDERRHDYVQCSAGFREPLTHADCDGTTKIRDEVCPCPCHRTQTIDG